MTKVTAAVDIGQSLNSEDDRRDVRLPSIDTESFDSIFQALRWEHVRKQAPICFFNTIRNRYFWANFVYLLYCIGILIIDFNSSLNGNESMSTNETKTEAPTWDLSSTSILNMTIDESALVRRLYVGMGVLHLISAFLYAWAWVGHSWADVILIPEYLNHIEGALYLWSAIWYFRQDTYGGYYTIAVHRIEITAAIVELVASVGWMISWYLTYTRRLGCGFTLDDPDIIAMLVTTIASIMYFVYNVQVNIEPEQYATNYLYTYADILYLIGACYYIFAGLRDDEWFWFLPLAGQYGIPPGKIHIDTTREYPSYGKPAILVTDVCRKRKKPKTTVQYRSFSNQIAVISNE